jgi:hypothetical protein
MTEVWGKTVAGLGSPQLLDMGFMEIIASVFIFFRNECQRLCREKPLPDKLPGGIFTFFFNPVWKKGTGIP